MSDYSTYTATELAADESFQRWVQTQDEAACLFWDTWLLQHPEQAQTIADARRLVSGLVFATDTLTEAQRNRMHAHILEAISSQPEILVLPLTVRRQWLRVAALLLAGLLATAGLIYWYGSRPIVHQTAYGETRTITLPDQSTVVLNANSQLTFGRDWADKGVREVRLKGEAFFEVARRNVGGAAVKFRVSTPDLTVEVLGTRFNVTQREARTAVTLNEGKIRLNLNTRQPAGTILMQPGEMVSFSETNQQLRKARVRPDDFSSWTRNYWVLDNTPLAEIARRIESTYGCRIHIADTSLLEESLTGVLPIRNLDNLLEVLSTTYDVKIQRTGTDITITK